MNARYTLVEAKVANFERDCFGLRFRLDQVSPFLEEVNLHMSPMSLVGYMMELEGMFKEDKSDSREA